jgi:AcrR family transcriptional regulator
MSEPIETHEPLETLCPKFFALEEEKRGRIINAAMKEFLHGFTAAKTDNIVKDAGISKGLLFHYFGTKENLYAFLIEHAIAIVKTEYMDLINTDQCDMLDFVWQSSLLKQDLSRRYPAVFDFITSTYLDTRHSLHPIQAAHLAQFSEMRNHVMNKAMANCDLTRFRSDIDPMKAIEIITWALAGYAEAATAKIAEDNLSTVGEIARENYDNYLDEFKSYLEILRRCFYK